MSLRLPPTHIVNIIVHAGKYLSTRNLPWHLSSNCTHVNSFQPFPVKRCTGGLKWSHCHNHPAVWRSAFPWIDAQQNPNDKLLHFKFTSVSAIIHAYINTRLYNVGVIGPLYYIRHLSESSNIFCKVTFLTFTIGSHCLLPPPARQRSRSQ